MSSTQSVAETIVVATDFSRHSDAAVQFALRRAKQLQAQLFVVHVLSTDDADERRIALERLAHAVPAADQLETSAEQAVMVGPFHRRIVEFANQHSASLIVIGTRGRSGLAHLALGSVAERVVRSASCPVAVISGNHTDADAKIVAEPIPFEEIPNADTPAVDLLLRAVRLRATDVHFDPLNGREIQVRLRIDGQLERYCKLDLNVADHLTQQLKLMANLDIADPFHPKEGRLQLPSEHRDLEVRITTAPVVHGEAVALRIFSRSNVFFPLDRLGFSASAQTIVESILRKGEGIVLITGPTSSGQNHHGLFDAGGAKPTQEKHRFH
ncbi:MAG: ATPase, T2SS/T4P/T4SS family [Pirellulaceae bacterium]